MSFNVIDRENWERSPYFEHYLRQTCTFSLTANLDITKLLEHLHQKEIKLYPAFIFMVSKVVNAHEEFRTCFNEDGVLGFWDEMIPSYTIFHKHDRSFSSIWTEFSGEFREFHKNYEHDLKRYSDVKGLFTKSNQPPNTFPLSSVPWVSFTGFNLNINNEGDFLLPIITGGKYFNLENKTLLPISLQMHHAVCDGYHAGKFVEGLQRLADTCHDWLP